VHQHGLEGETTFDVYFTVDGRLISSSARRPTRPRLTAAATEVIHKEEPACPSLTLRPWMLWLSDSVSPRRFSATLIGVFAALALSIGGCGVYGVMSYTVSQRTQELSAHALAASGTCAG